MTAYGSVKKPGDACSSCITRAMQSEGHEVRELMLANGALVCPSCDCVAHWPSIKKRTL